MAAGRDRLVEAGRPAYPLAMSAGYRIALSRRAVLAGLIAGAGQAAWAGAPGASLRPMP